MINKRSKASRERGHKTHGYGSMKKNRGAGNRGGRGNAGSGKRGDANKPKFAKDKKYFGKHGFKPKNPTIVRSINIADISLETFEKFTEKKGDSYELNLTKAGFTKLLGKGQITQKINITISNFSPKAEEKIKAAGGSIIKG